MYRKKIHKEALNEYKEQYVVISEKLFLGEPIIQIYSETDPGNGFELISADLSDVYFSKIFA